MISSLTFLYFLAAGLKASLPLLLPFIAKDIHITLTDVGVLSSLLNALGIIVALPAAYIAKKLGGLKVLIFTFLIYAGVFIGVSFAMNFYTLFSFFLIAGFGFGLFLPIALAVIAKLIDKKTRGRQLASFSANGDIGRIILGGSISFLVALVGWRQTMIGYGVVTLAVFLFMYFKFIHKAIAVEIKEEPLPSVLSLKHFLKNRHFMLANLAGSLDIFASNSLFIFLPFLLISKGFDPKIIGSFTAAYFVGSYAGKTVIGRLVDRYGNKPLFIFSEFCMALCIIALVLTHSLFLIIALSLILGGLTKGTVPASLSIVTESLDQHGNYEKGFALNTLIINIASTLAPLLLGFLSDSFGINTAFYTSATVACLATLPVFLLMRNFHPKV